MSGPPPPYTPTAEPHPQGGGHQYSTEQTPILVVYESLDFGENPAILTCPHCGDSIVTRTKYEVGTHAYLVSSAICALGLIIPLLWAGYCLLPFCLTGCQDVEHRCPKCNRYLGHFRRL